MYALFRVIVLPVANQLHPMVKVNVEGVAAIEDSRLVRKHRGESATNRCLLLL